MTHSNATHHPVISATGLFTPEHSISNAELVESFNAFVERAFAGIPWKTRDVLAGTKQALSDCRLVSLRTLTDADDEGSLVRALGETRMGGSIAALWRLLDRTRLVRCPSLFETKLATLAAALIPVRRGPPLPSVAS